MMTSDPRDEVGAFASTNRDVRMPRCPTFAAACATTTSTCTFNSPGLLAGGGVSTAFSNQTIGQPGTQGPGDEMRGSGAQPALAMARISLALFMAGFATFSLIYSTQPLLPEFTAEFGVDPATSSLAQLEMGSVGD